MTGSMNAAEFANIARCERDLWWFRGQRRIMANVLEPLLRGRAIVDVLEAGCGTGYQSAEFARRYGWRMFPLDLDSAGLHFAATAGVGRLTQADIGQLPFPGGSFDAVTSLDVLVHFAMGAEDAALREFARVLRPKGLLILRVAALDILRSRHSAFAHERQRFTQARLQKAVSSAGIHTLYWTYANTLLLPVALAKFRVWEVLTRKPPASGVTLVPGWLDALLYSALHAESILLGMGFNLPLGQSLVLIGEKP
jgi:ubiquinone/menaquinone biosynthesis C-methylase UbiE